eukprot:GEMP01100323.1.p1 GENE.GEMP01100323.1~~GEMP01100323.1.p1  ORF type:complete len:153 (-),score=11.35 GEMP01100323.1:95-553(-)
MKTHIFDITLLQGHYLSRRAEKPHTCTASFLTVTLEHFIEQRRANTLFSEFWKYKQPIEVASFVGQVADSQPGNGRVIVQRCIRYSAVRPIRPPDPSGPLGSIREGLASATIHCVSNETSYFLRNDCTFPSFNISRHRRVPTPFTSLCRSQK